MKKFGLFICMITIAALSGCVSWGGHGNSGFTSKTILKSSGFELVKEVSANAQATYILGSIMLDDSQADLYARAFKQLRDKADLKGATALANVTTDIVVKNFLIIKWVTLHVSADVVRFTK